MENEKASRGERSFSAISVCLNRRRFMTRSAYHGDQKEGNSGGNNPMVRAALCSLHGIQFTRTHRQHRLIRRRIRMRSMCRDLEDGSDRAVFFLWFEQPQPPQEDVNESLLSFRFGFCGLSQTDEEFTSSRSVSSVLSRSCKAEDHAPLSIALMMFEIFFSVSFSWIFHMVSSGSSSCFS